MGVLLKYMPFLDGRECIRAGKIEGDRQLEDANGRTTVLLTDQDFDPTRDRVFPPGLTDEDIRDAVDAIDDETGERMPWAMRFAVKGGGVALDSYLKEQPWDHARELMEGKHDAHRWEIVIGDVPRDRWMWVQVFNPHKGWVDIDF